VAPRTALLTLMHAAGKLFPRGDRSPAIVPVTEGGLRRRIASEGALEDFAWARSHRINSGFYLSNAMALTRSLPLPSAEDGAAAPGVRA
jgi:magnesium-protoporphyrin O-methyltransferase